MVLLDPMLVGNFLRKGLLHLGILVVISSAWSCSNAPERIEARETVAGHDPATQKMVRLLEKIASQGNFQTDGFLNMDYLRYLENIEAKTKPGPRAEQLFKLSRQYLFSGRTTEAIETLQEIQAIMDTYPKGFSEETQLNYLVLLAISHLRKGEQDNCLEGHNPETCIFPIAGGGIHQNPKGSADAIPIYEEILRRDPENLNARWLLNLAHMTLGSYPDEVAKAWLIPPELWQSDHEIPRFSEVAMGTQTALWGLAGGVVIEDFNDDGFFDMLTSTWGLKEDLVYLENNGKGSFVDQTAAAGLTGIKGGLNMIQADVDNDGRKDVLVLRGGWRNHGGHHPNSLLRNLGGRFVDITEEAGLLAFSPTQTASFADFDRDGDVDLFIGNETTPNNLHPCRLYRNDGGRFTDITVESQLQILGYVKAVIWGDINNDGLPDLYISKLNGDNVLLRNEGPQPQGQGWRFTDITLQAGVAAPKQSFPGWFFDYDNDGWLDLFVSGYGQEYENTVAGSVLADYLGQPNLAEQPRLYRNQGNDTFEDVTQAVGLNHVFLTMGCGFGDLDNDGWLDFYLGTGAPDFQALVPNLMWRNDRGERFQDVTTAGGFGHLQKGHGIAFADLDNDGDQDIYAVMGGAYTGDTYPNALFENPGFDNHWLRLHFVGTQSSKDALGTRFVLEVSADTGTRQIHGYVSSGGSFGAASLEQHVGLGKTPTVGKLTVTWPVSGTQTFDLPEINQRFHVIEGQPKLIKAPVQSTTFAKPTSQDHHHP